MYREEADHFFNFVLSDILFSLKKELRPQFNYGPCVYM